MGTLQIALPYVLVSFLISLVLTPIVKKIGLHLDAYAIENAQ